MALARTNVNLQLVLIVWDFVHEITPIINKMVPQDGLEPSRDCSHRILSPACLPIPPLRLQLIYNT